MNPHDNDQPHETRRSVPPRWLQVPLSLLLVIGALAALLASPARAADPEPRGTIHVEQRGPDDEVALGGCWAVTRVATSQLVDTFCDYNDGAQDGTTRIAGLGVGQYRLEQDGHPIGFFAADGPLLATVVADDVVTVTSFHLPLPTIAVRTTHADGELFPGSCWRLAYPDQMEGGTDVCDGDDGALDGVSLLERIEPDAYRIVHLTAPTGYRRVADHHFTLGEADETFTFALELAVPPANVTPPSILGTPIVGSELTGDRGTWSGDEARFGERWERCDLAGNACRTIVNAATYTVTEADLGSTLVFIVSATNDGGRAIASSAPVAVLDEAPANTVAPSLSGTVGIGQPLTVIDGEWSGAPDLTYQWQRCTEAGACADIAGATGATYTPSIADADHRLRAVVTGTNPLGSAQAITEATTVIAAPVSSSPQELLDELITTIRSSGLPRTRANLLVISPFVARLALYFGAPRAACANLRVFEVTVTRYVARRWLTATSGAELRGRSEAIRTALGC